MSTNSVAHAQSLSLPAVTTVTSLSSVLTEHTDLLRGVDGSTRHLLSEVYGLPSQYFQHKGVGSKYSV